MNIDTLPEPFTRQADYFKALAHPARLQILWLLWREGEACVCHLEALLQKRQAYVSQQIGVLKEAGLLAERKEGLFVFYRLADPNMAQLLQQSLTFAQIQTGAVTPLPTLSLGESGPCSCPTCKPVG